MGLLDGSGRPLLNASNGVTQILPFIIEDGSILFISAPFQRPQLSVLGASHPELQFILEKNAAIPFTSWQGLPEPGFYVYEFTFKSTYPPGPLNVNPPAMFFIPRRVRDATVDDFPTHRFQPPKLNDGTPLNSTEFNPPKPAQ